MENLELIIGIGIGAGLIFSLFAFFRNFYYMPTVNTGEASGANISRQSNFLFFSAFMGALIFFMYLFSPEGFELQKTKDNEKESSPNIPTQLNMSPSNKYHVSFNDEWKQKESDKFIFERSIEQKIDSIEKLVKGMERNSKEEMGEFEIPQTIYMVQLSASENFNFAKAYAKKIKEQYSNYSVCLFIPPKGNVTKVLIGEYTTESDAIHLLQYLEQEEHKDFWMVEVSRSQFESIMIIN